MHVQVMLSGVDQEGKEFQTTGRSMDISRTGCGIVLDQEIASLGSMVSISSARKFQSKATVQWTRHDSQTGQMRVGLRFVEPKMNLGFKIAASLLLSWAFLAQATFARPHTPSQTAAGRSEVPRQEQVVSSPAALPAHAIAYEGNLGSAGNQSTENMAVENLAGEPSWIEQAILEAGKQQSDRGNTQVQIGISKENYLSGETITAGTYHISNPSNHDQRIELKTWLTSPEGKQIPVGNVGADGQYVIPSGSDAEYGPVQVLPVTDQMPAGGYEFNTRMIHPVTGAVLGANIKSFTVQTATEVNPSNKPAELPALSLDMQTSKSGYLYGEEVSLIEGCRLVNLSPGTTPIELKIWLEGPGLNPITVYSLGGDGSLVLTPQATMKLEPLQPFKITKDLPAGTYHLKSRIVDPVTGQGLHETATRFDIR